MADNELAPQPEMTGIQEKEYENVFRRGIQETPKEKMLARHRLWLATIQHEYPMPYVPYRIGVYIRFYNQTQYKDEVYLSKHKQWFLDDISLCPKWKLVDFYIDTGSKAPHMESSREWCRLLEDCFSGKVNLIVTQKAGNVSDDPNELTFISRILATQKQPVGIYFISEDIFTLASYYREDISDRNLLPEGWQPLPPDDLDEWPVGERRMKLLSAMSDSMDNQTQEGDRDVGMDT